MNQFVKKVFVIISVCFNVLFLLFTIFALTRKTATVAFYNMETKIAAYTTGACVVSIPSRGADLVLGTPEFSLQQGDEAALQFSLFLDRRQMNLALEPLYDHAVVSVEHTGYGLLIKARSQGETVLQTMTGNGIRDIAIIKVIPASIE